MAGANTFMYRNWQTGDDQPFTTTKVSGLGKPDARLSAVPNASKHGAVVSAEFLGERYITLEGNLVGTEEELSAGTDLLGETFGPTNIIHPLMFNLWGQREERCYCLPTRSTWDFDIDAVHGRVVRWIAELVAGDPRRYLDVEDVLDGAGLATNEGNISTPPIITVTGPATDVMIRRGLTIDDPYVKKIGVVGAGEVLVFDFPARTLKLDGVSKYDKFEGEWWELLPGGNNLVVTGLTGGDVETRWRSAWV